MAYVEFLQAALDFTGSIAVAPEQPMLADMIEFEVLSSSRFRAYAAQPLKLGGRFRVRVSEGVAQEIQALLGGAIRKRGPIFGASLSERLGLASDELALGATYLFALLFVSLHEAAHVLAGHVEFEAENHKKLGIDFLGISEDSVDSTKNIGDGSVAEDSRRIQELEADGCALELLYDVRMEAAGMLELGDATGRSLAAALHQADRRIVDRLTLFGALCCCVVLERYRRAGHADAAEYPFPEARMANVANRYLLRSCAAFYRPKLTARDGGLYLSRTLSMGAAEAIGEAVIREVMPVLSWAEDLAREGGIEMNLLSDLDKRFQPDGNLLWRDINTMAAGGRPSRTVGGRELARLADLSAEFDATMAPYRRMSWS